MAKKRQNPQGVLTKPPVSVSRGAGAAASANRPKRDPKINLPKQGERKFLNRREGQVINQRTNQDFRLGRQAGQTLRGALPAFDQGIDWTTLPEAPKAPDWAAAPEAPVGGDFDQWRQDQIDQTYKTYTSRMEPQFKEQLADFEQMAIDRGWVPGSDLYNREKSRIEQRQDEARRQALTEAQGIAGQNAQQFFNVGTTARGNALQEMTNLYGFGRQYRGDTLSDIQQQRYTPLQEYQMLIGAQSGYGPQNAQYSQNAQQAERNNAAAMAQAMALRPPAFGGFGSPQEQAAFEDARARDMASFTAQLQQQYAPKQPRGNNWYDLAGGIVGAGLGGWAQGGFQSPWG